MILLKDLPKKELRELMKGWWYHGSSAKFNVLKRSKARAIKGSPEHDMQNAIYLTPSRSVAVVMGVKTSGRKIIDYSATSDKKSKMQVFGKVKKQPIFIYCFKPMQVVKAVGAKNIEIADDHQIVINADTLKPYKREELPFEEVLQYYNIVVENLFRPVRWFTRKKTHYCSKGLI